MKSREFNLVAFVAAVTICCVSGQMFGMNPNNVWLKRYFDHHLDQARHTIREEDLAAAEGAVKWRANDLLMPIGRVFCFGMGPFIPIAMLHQLQNQSRGLRNMDLWQGHDAALARNYKRLAFCLALAARLGIEDPTVGGRDEPPRLAMAEIRLLRDIGCEYDSIDNGAPELDWASLTVIYRDEPVAMNSMEALLERNWEDGLLDNLVFIGNDPAVPLSQKINLYFRTGYSEEHGTPYLWPKTHFAISAMIAGTIHVSADPDLYDTMWAFNTMPGGPVQMTDDDEEIEKEIKRNYVLMGGLIKSNDPHHQIMAQRITQVGGQVGSIAVYGINPHEIDLDPRQCHNFEKEDITTCLAIRNLLGVQRDRFYLYRTEEVFSFMEMDEEMTLLSAQLGLNMRSEYNLQLEDSVLSHRINDGDPGKTLWIIHDQGFVRKMDNILINNWGSQMLNRILVLTQVPVIPELNPIWEWLFDQDRVRVYYPDQTVKCTDPYILYTFVATDRHELPPLKTILDKPADKKVSYSPPKSKVFQKKIKEGRRAVSPRRMRGR